MPPQQSNKLFDWIDVSSDQLKLFDPEIIFYRSLQTPWESFELLNSSSDHVNYLSRIQLIRGLCGDAESDYNNCSEVCSRREDIFSSWKTIQHCLTLASLSLAGSLFTGLRESSRDLINDALHHFSVKDAAQFPGELVLNRTFECAMASCETDSGQCQMKELTSSYILDGRVYWNVLSASLMNMCGGIQVDVNNDVAGPGVIISYFIQIGIALFAWAFILLPKILNATAASARFFRRILHSFGFKKRLVASRPSSSQRLQRTNLAHATSTLLVEFHEAQCFFVASVEIALLYSRPSASLSGSNNTASLDQFMGMVQAVAGAGTCPILLTQVSLSRARLDSTYYLTLSTAALGLAIVAVATAGLPDIDEMYILFKGHNDILECGGNPSLTSFCGGSFFSPNTFTTKMTVSFCSFIVLLWLDKLWDGIVATTWLHEAHRRLTQRQQKLVAWAGLILTKVVAITFLLWELGVIMFLGLSLFYLYYVDLENDESEWGVGQVIAVLIWAPVISKYLYLIIFGVEKGFLYRLSRAFMVVKRPIEIDSDDDGDTAPGAASDIDATPLMPVR